MFRFSVLTVMRVKIFAAFTVCGMLLLTSTGYTEDEPIEEWEEQWVRSVYEHDSSQSLEDGFKPADEALTGRAILSLKAYCTFLTNYLFNRSYVNYKNYNDPDVEEGVSHAQVTSHAELADLLFKHCSKYLPTQ